MNRQGIIISALRGGSGKTIISLGVIGALRKNGYTIAPFKKGPDYIDAGWLALAANSPCYNLDTYLLSPQILKHSFFNHSHQKDIIIIEGNRGLYDSIDSEGSTSTADLSILLQFPVILVLDCTKTTRTLAAILMGCQLFNPNVQIKGVILNQVAGSRHESIITKSIEQYNQIPVLGAIPKLKSNIFPERHMGLIPNQEHDWADHALEKSIDLIQNYVSLEQLSSIIYSNTTDYDQTDSNKSMSSIINQTKTQSIRIGIARDEAFQFYYEENIDALKQQGAEIIYVSPLNDKELPYLDALYIGGGFPETHARQLANNILFRKQLYSLAQNNLPIYAECGGLMYMGTHIIVEGHAYEMCGIFPAQFGLYKKPQGHGYTQFIVDQKNPFYDIGTEIKGHEFHYSKVIDWQGSDDMIAFQMIRGKGFHNNRDGVWLKNVLGLYTHIHALGTTQWVNKLIAKAVSHKASQ